MYRVFVKRFFDIVISFIAILVFSPFFIILPFVIAIFLGVPVLFTQKRVGKYNKIFNLYKFRSMTNKKDNNGNLLPDEQRLSKFGKLLRKTSLDELPQLFSILKGDMTIIGPRPKTVEEVMFIKDKQYNLRHCVKPGITGLSIIKGRNDLDPDKAYRYDLLYAANLNFILDMKIFVITFISVLFRKGVNKKGTVSFIPHHIFWVQKGQYTTEEAENIRSAALEVIKSKSKRLNILTVKQFKFGRRKLRSKYKIWGNRK